MRERDRKRDYLKLFQIYLLIQNPGLSRWTTQPDLEARGITTASGIQELDCASSRASGVHLSPRSACSDGSLKQTIDTGGIYTMGAGKQLQDRTFSSLWFSSIPFLSSFPPPFLPLFLPSLPPLPLLLLSHLLPLYHPLPHLLCLFLLLLLLLFLLFLK